MLYTMNEWLIKLNVCSQLIYHMEENLPCCRCLTFIFVRFLDDVTCEIREREVLHAKEDLANLDPIQK